MLLLHQHSDSPPATRRYGCGTLVPSLSIHAVGAPIPICPPHHRLWRSRAACGFLCELSQPHPVTYGSGFRKWSITSHEWALDSPPGLEVCSWVLPLLGKRSHWDSLYHRRGHRPSAVPISDRGTSSPRTTATP